MLIESNVYFSLTKFGASEWLIYDKSERPLRAHYFRNKSAAGRKIQAILEKKTKVTKVKLNSIK